MTNIMFIVFVIFEIVFAAYCVVTVSTHIILKCYLRLILFAAFLMLCFLRIIEWSCFLQVLFGQNCKTFLDIVACPNWTKLQSLG